MGDHDAVERLITMAWRTHFVTSDVAILDIDAVVTRSSGTARNHATFVYAKRNGEWTAVAQRVFPKP